MASDGDRHHDPAACHPIGYTVESYFALAEEGVIAPDDRVELLEGIVVAMPPHTPLHAAGVRQVEEVLRRALGPGLVFSGQLPLVLTGRSVPEPDLAVVPGDLVDYVDRHPTRALLVVEVADSTLAQDRLTKSGIYARAAIPDYWIVNLRDSVVEWACEPDPSTGLWGRSGTASGSGIVTCSSFPGRAIRAADLLPPAR